MPTPHELETKFWEALASDMTMMLGLDGVEDGAAWFDGGKDDPKLALLRLAPENAEIWLDASSVVAGIKLLFGADPKEDYRDNVAKVSFGTPQ